jgi:hypothetical protein
MNILKCTKGEPQVHGKNKEEKITYYASKKKGGLLLKVWP